MRESSKEGAQRRLVFDDDGDDGEAEADEEEEETVEDDTVVSAEPAKSQSEVYNTLYRNTRIF